jgi:hypothetical protein
MPQLGMAQDTGIAGQLAEGAGRRGGRRRHPVRGRDRQEHDGGRSGPQGLLAATLAEAGEEVPVGDPVAIIST